MTPDAAAAEPRLSNLLARGLAELDLHLTGAQQAALLGYIGLLAKWNRAYNLTAIRDPAVMVPRHLLDSLTVLPLLCGDRVLDVGTGAGLPGIPLAIARPDVRFTLLDANGKKIRFVRQAVLDLGLTNVTPVQSRVESYQAAEPFSCIVSRAFASLADMLGATGHLLAAEGCWVAMKGPAEGEERSALPAGFAVTTRAVRVPGLAADHRLLAIVRSPR
jgi:16S rRNA (guanine527-N7)-methyltransferase